MARRVAKVPVVEAPVEADRPSQHNLVLTETLDLAAACDLAKALLALRGSGLTIDASQSRRLGGQCAQILVSAVRTWSHDQVDMRIVHASTEFVAGLRLLGLESEIELREAC